MSRVVADIPHTLQAYFHQYKILIRGYLAELTSQALEDLFPASSAISYPWE